MADLETELPATQESLVSKTAAASHQYALKHYDQAADLYSQATAVQAELNGEMAPQNAELLYAYGRCLYKVAIEKSDVLGGKVAGSGGADGKQQKGTKRKNADRDGGASTSEGTQTDSKAQDATKTADKPYFQIEGDDEGWDEDDEDGEDAAEGEEPEEEDDDLAIAYEVLDTARILFTKQLDSFEDSEEPSTSISTTTNRTSPTKTRAKGKGKASDTTPSTPSSTTQPSTTKSQIQERLADTYDFQSEINLENEQFLSAANDAKAALALKTALHSFDSSIVGEAHFKVSLALEFAAKTTTERPDELGEMTRQVEGVDEDVLRESIQHMEKAIESTKMRVEKETREIEEGQDAKRRAKMKRDLEEVKEIVGDMEERLKDLRGLPEALSIAALQDPAAPKNPMHEARGLLSSLLGDSPADVQARLAEATKNANDLTSVVKKRKKEVQSTGGSAASQPTPTNGKRKMDEASGKSNGKKARVEDADDADELI